jgi:replicative DNA helicase
MTDYIPPNDLNAEIAVLGGSIESESKARSAVETLLPDHFYREAHRLVFEAIRDLLNRGSVPDLPAVTGIMQDRGQLQDVGGAVALYDLTANFEGHVYFDQHVRTVRDKWARRKAIETMRKAAVALRTDAEYAGTVDGMFADLQSALPTGKVADPTDVSLDFYERLNGQTVPHFTSGWTALDKRFTLPRGMLTIMTGLPGSGKSTFLDALLHRYCERDANVVFFSPEQGPPGRHLVGLVQTRVGFDPVGSDRLDDIEEARQWWVRRVSWIEDHRDNSTSAVLAIARARAAKGANILVIDPYNNLAPDGRFDRQDLYIQDLLRKVKRFARETDMAVVIVAHPRSVPMVHGTESVYRVPTAGDISGGQEWWNHADLIVTVWRNQSGEQPDVYGDRNTVRIIVQKVRDAGRVGNMGEARFAFVPEKRNYVPMESGL